MAQKVDNKTLLALCLTGHSQTDIARTLNMTKTAICRRINTDEFQELLSTYRKKMLDGILTDLTANAQKSVDTLVSLLDDPNPFIRLQAASKILSLSQDYGLQRDLLRDIEIWKQERALSLNEAVI